MNTYKPHEFAEKLNVSVKTLQRWDNAGILKAQRSPTGRRYYTEIQYLEYIGQLAKQEKQRLVVNNEELSPEKEMVEDLISVIHVFSCRIYGLRKYKGKIKKDEELC